MAALARRIREVASLESPDVLHPHSPVLNALPALWAGRRLGLPVVYDIRAFWEDAAVDHGSYGPHSWKYRLVRAVETWVCRRADQVAVLCGGLKDDLTGRGIPGEKLTVVPNGISIEDFGHWEPNEQYRTAWSLAGKRVVGFIGSFYRYEGLDLLVKAFARLAPARPDLRLLLVGGGEVEGELRADVTRLALDEKVIMPGRLPHEVIPGIYGLTDVLAYPRHAMRLTELVTPLKPLEAMAQGKAIVASDIGGHRELIQHGRTGLLFRPDDASALAEALAALLDDGQLQRSLADEAARTVRQERSWDQTLSAYADIYARLGSGHAARIR